MKHVNAYPFVGKDYEKGFIIVWAMVFLIDFVVLGKRMEKKCLLPMVIRFIPIGFLPVVKTRH